VCIRTTATIAVLVALLGCDQQRGVSHPEGEITRVEIYYRNFDSLSPISHSKSDLLELLPSSLTSMRLIRSATSSGYCPTSAIIFRTCLRKRSTITC
jgi:hypothetical protein